MSRWVKLLVPTAGLMLMSATALAAGAQTLGVDPLGTALKQPELASGMKMAVTLTGLALLPAALICLTCFVRIVVVLSMLRHAVGLPETPPNVVIITLSLFLTLFAMQPVVKEIDQSAWRPYRDGRLNLTQAAEQGLQPLKLFMLRQTREQDMVSMVDAAGVPRPQRIEDVGMAQLIPAFLLSELRTAFQIGFMVFLPFLLVDLIVAAVLMALGMMMVPPATIALPIKLLLFVLIDGWSLVSRALIETVV